MTDDANSPPVLRIEKKYGKPKNSIILVELRKGEAYVESTGTTDFMFSYIDGKKRKPKKVYFKAADMKERDLWVTSI